MTLSFVRSAVSAVAVAAALLVAACGRESPDQFIASAQDYLSRNDAPAAIIQLKNALKARPDSASARLLLGQALAATGDIAGAQTEWRKAQDLGASPEDVVPQLAETLLLQAQYGKVTTDYAGQQLANTQAQARLKTTVAKAWQRQGQDDKFQTTIEEALQAQADYAPALIELARASAARGQIDEALASLDKVPKESTSAAQALKLRGDVLMYGKRDADGALMAYQEAIKVNPSFAEGQAAIVQLLLFQKKTDAAAEAVAGLERMAPGTPQTLYLQAVVAYGKDDFKAAQEHSGKLLALTPDNARALELAGMTELRVGSNAKAEVLLAKAVQLAPAMPMARRGLVASYVRLGRIDKAIATLPPDVEGNDQDPGMMALAGQVYMLHGDVDRAQRYFAKASSLDPKDPAKRTSLALSNLASGQGDAALGELESIASSDDGVVADMALINALLQQGKVDQALKAINALEKKRPADVLPIFLRGRALLLKRDAAGARKAMEQALTMDANYFPAVGVLAVLDNAEKRPDDARARIEAAIQRQPGNAQAHVALVELRAANGAPQEELAGLLRKAVEAAPGSPVPRMLLAEHYLRNKAPKDALIVAQQAVAAVPDDVQLLDVLGRAQSANGEHNQAQSTFNRIAALRPESPQPLLRMASAYLIAGDQVAAGQSLRKALEIDPQLLQAQQALGNLAMTAQKPEEALAISRTVQKQRPKEAVGYLMEGQIHAAGKAWDKAADALRAGLKQVVSPQLAVPLHEVLLSAGKKPDAERWAAEWIRTQPKDAVFPLYLGSRAIDTKDLPEALRQFERVIALQPDNAVALNNRAWLKGQLKLDGALVDAERANTLAPNQPAFMDTWAMLLSAANQHDRAVELQKKAVQLQPQLLPLKLNLAKIQIKAGNKDAARVLLDELSAVGDKFSSQAEVEQLKKTL